MPALGTNYQQDRDETSVDILSAVELVSFKATPDHIGPFGASHLTWKVEGPPGFQVKLDYLSTQKTGEKVVQPAVTTSYRLSAQAGQASRTLGHVTVTVDGTGCESYEPLVNPKSTLQGALTTGVQGEAGIYFRSQPPSVSFSPGRITFGLRLAQEIDWFSNPDIDIDASFGLSVVDGALVTTGAQVSVDVSVPWYAWATPGAVPALAIALDMGKDKARKSAYAAVDGLTQLINAFAAPPQGKRMRSVQIDNGNGGAGLIQITACPYDLLRQFAAISGLAVIR